MCETDYQEMWRKRRELFEGVDRRFDLDIRNLTDDELSDKIEFLKEEADENIEETEKIYKRKNGSNYLPKM